MKASFFFKFCAVCCALSGLCLIIGWTLDIGRDSLIGSSIALVGYVLAILSFMGIGAAHGVKFSIFGFCGFVLIIIANALFIPWVFLDMARISGIAPQVDWWYIERNGPTGILAIIGGASFVFGYLIFAIDLIRAKVLSRWPACLLILAALQPAIFPLTGVTKLLPRIAGIALLLFAYQLWMLSTNRKP